MKCGREKGGKNVEELGICPAYPDHGQDCWEVVGTFCKGKIQGSIAQKIDNCSKCRWYKRITNGMLKRSERDAWLKDARQRILEVSLADKERKKKMDNK
jgi:hypothetical protein